MEMQGTPIGSTNQGMKVQVPQFYKLLVISVRLTLVQNTTDPATNDVITEGSGAVTSDSLAAESVRSGGDFAENRGSEPLKVKGSNSTLANDDTSAATTLPPARDAESRDDQSQSQDTSSSSEQPGGVKDDEEAGGQSNIPAKTSAEGLSGDGAVEKSGPDVDAAPSYVTNLAVENTAKPKGKNITEGGFDSDDTNSAMPEPGSEDDPGRASLQGFQNQQAATVGSGPRQGGVTGDGQYDILEDDQKLE